MLVYVAGPYRAENREGITKNILQARAIGVALWQMGHTALVPHLNTAYFDDDCTLPAERYLDGDLQMLARCDAIVMTPDWERSEGAQGEHDFAVNQRIPIYVYPTLPPLHPTEVRSPVQVRAFAAALGRMYRTHLKKNADYSPANILATGEIGLVTRMWDKMARLLNLSGFRVEIAGSSFEAPRAPQNEAIEDTYEDLAVYGVIGRLLRDNEWGR